MESVAFTSTDKLEELNLSPTDEVDEVTQNIAALLDTPQGSVPLERGMGMPMGFKDQPQYIATALFQSELAMALSEYEPRAEIKNVSAEQTEDCSTGISAEVILNGG